MTKIPIISFFVVMTVICAYSYFLTAATGSYLGYNEDWKNHIVFTPESVEEPANISVIDKIIYAFNIQPVITIVFILSSVILLVGIIHCVMKVIRSSNDKNQLM